MERVRPFSSNPLKYRSRQNLVSTKSKTDVVVKNQTSPMRGSNYFSKEELYDQVYKLKKNVNALQEENKHLKAKIIRLEKKKISSLLSPAKSLHTAFLSEPEKHKLLLRVSELEFENKFLKDEVAKNKLMIDEFTNNPPPDFKKIYEKYALQCLKIKKLKERQKLYMSQLGLDEENNEKAIELSKKNSERKLSERKNSVQITSKDTEKFAKLFAKLYENSCVNQLEFDEIWCVMNPNSCDNIGLQEFIRGFHGLGIENPQEEIELLFYMIACDKKVDQNAFEKALIKYKPAHVPSYSDLKHSLEHLYLHLQIQRIDLASFLKLFTADSYYYDELYKIFTSAPIQLDKNSAEKISRYLLISKFKVMKKDIEDKIQHFLKDWGVLSEEDEINFDEKIKNSMKGSWEVFIKKCQSMDKGNREIITFSQFVKICKSIGLEFDIKFEKYLKILFYTDNYQLDTVPYVNFAIAYGPEKHSSR